MKHARGFFLALAILIMPNAAYYVFNWILVLKRQINEENFLRLPLYVDYIPEAIILVAMCLLIIYAVKDFTRAGKYGYMAAPTILPVSYTHLDVYKRQVLYCVNFPVITLGLGVYLPFYLSATAAIGGAVRFIVDKAAPKFERDGKGTIIASGLLGGESIVGVVIAMYYAYQIIV